jgi:hypothetical protein
MKNGLISSLPSISEDEINDKSKGDFVVKGIAILQVLWLVIQFATRHILGLPSPPIEVVALSSAICTIIMYLIWLEKPQDVRLSTPVHTARRLNLYDKHALLRLNRKSFV